MKPDIDNVVARLKPLIDGCALAFGINDRDLELGRVRRVHTLDEQAGTLVLHFDTEEHKLFRLSEWQNARVCYSKNVENEQQNVLSFTGEQQTRQMSHDETMRYRKTIDEQCRIAHQMLFNNNGN
jgi:hypothetical protein